MSIRLGRIPYLNSEVFYQDFPLDLIEVTDYVPSALARAARRGDVDIGPVPLVTCFELEEQFMPMGDFCVAVKDKARSVLLFSKKPMADLDGARIGITGESATSVRLLKILLSDYYRVQPEQYVSTKEPKSDAILLIGDAALNNRNGLPSYNLVYDLGEMWKEWTGLPFVFARWIVRKDLNTAALDLLSELLDRSLKRGLKRIDEIAAERTDLSMSVDEVREYLHGFTYVLGQEEKQSIALFRDYVEKHDRVEEPVKEKPRPEREAPSA